MYLCGGGGGGCGVRWQKMEHVIGDDDENQGGI